MTERESEERLGNTGIRWICKEEMERAAVEEG